MILIVVILVLVYFIIRRTEIIRFDTTSNGYPNNTWVSVTHYMISIDSSYDTHWTYYDPKSNIEFNLGKTIIFKTHEDVNKYFKKRFTNKHTVSLENINEARRQNYDSVQILKHDKDPDNIPKFEIIDLQKYHGTLFKIGKLAFDANLKTMKRYRNKYSKKWNPRSKFVISHCGPNFKVDA